MLFQHVMLCRGCVCGACPSAVRDSEPPGRWARVGRMRGDGHQLQVIGEHGDPRAAARRAEGDLAAGAVRHVLVCQCVADGFVSLVFQWKRRIVQRIDKFR